MSNASTKAYRYVSTRLENATGYHIAARRNMLVGLWAGARFGLSERVRADYAPAVIRADLSEPGSRNLINNIVRDFAERCARVTLEEILETLREEHRLAAMHSAIAG